VPIPLLNGYDAAAYMVVLLLIARTTRAVRQLAAYRPECCCFHVFFRGAEIVGGVESRDLVSSKFEMRSLS